MKSIFNYRSGYGLRNLLRLTVFLLVMAFACPAFAAVLAGWNVSTQTGGVGNFGTSPLTAATADPNLTVGGLTRGAGVGGPGSANSGAARAWGGNNWASASAAAAVTANQYATFSLTANAGNQVSFASISKFDYRRSATGATTGVLQYQVGAGAFTDITTVSYTVTTTGGGSIAVPIDLSTITALQNVPAGTTVTFRIVNYGGTGATGTWYIFDVANSTANDFEITGTVTSTFVNGSCGGDNGLTLAATAPTNLCSTGVASAITGSGHPWNWSCNGSGGGSTATCSATIASYTLNFAAGANGSISSGAIAQTVDYGQSASAVTATANSGYTFQNWTVGGSVVSTANPLTVNPVNASQNLTANFTGAVVNGACGGDNGQTLAASTPANLCSTGTASVVTGSGHPWNWSCSGINGGSVTACAATIQTYNVTFSAGTKGTLSGTASQTVDFGGSTTPVGVTATSGTTFLNWTGTGGFVTTTANPLTVTNVIANQAITSNYSGLLTIFHVNDTHARLTPHKMAPPIHGTTDEGFEDVGGAAYMAAKMLELTAATPDSLVIDAGDISEGSPIGDFSATSPITIPGYTISACAPLSPGAISSNCGMTQFYQILSQKLLAQRGRGMDAVVVGNHDVRDASYIQNLESLRNSGVPVLSVNVRDIATGNPHFLPYTIVTVAGKRVGILGYTTQAAEVGASLSSTLQVVDCDWSAATNTLSTTTCHLKSYVDELRTNPKDPQGNPVAPVDLVVLAAHIGHSGMVDPNPKVSPKLLVDDGVTKLPEVSVNGHWHSWADTPAWQPATLNYKTTITESGSYLTYIGELKINDTGKFVSGANYLLRNTDITPDPDVQSFVTQLITQFDANAGTTGKPHAYDVVGYTADNLLLDNKMRWWSPNEYPWSGNNTAGQWICDAMQWKAAQLFGSCDLAIETGGGVRADIPAGPVTYLQVYETFPWSDDTYVRIDMTGQDIVNFLKVTNMDSGFSRGLEVWAYDGVATSVTFNGQPIDLTKTYTVAINNYMLAHPPSGYTWPTHSTPLTSTVLVRDSLSEFMHTAHPDQATAYSVGGSRYHLNSEFAGGFRAVITMMNDNDTRPTFEDAFIRLLSANPETLARRGSAQVPNDLVNADGTINPANHLAEHEWYRSYLGFKTGALKPGDIVEIWGKGSFFGGNPEFVEQEGIYADGVEFKIVGHDASLAKPAFKSSINEFWNDFNKNHYVQFLATKSGTNTVTDQNGQTIALMDATGYVNKAVPGIVGDTVLVSGVPTMENYGMRFRCDSVTVSTGPIPNPVVTSRINPTPAATTSGTLPLTATASTSAGIYFLTPLADTQVASGKPTTNYGASTNIYVQSSSTNAFGNERGWLKFDLSTLPAGKTITGATLQLWNWKSAGDSLDTEVRSVSDDTWTETGLTWSTQSALGSILDTQTLTSGTINIWYSWNVTPFVRQKLAGNKLVSLAVKAVTEDLPNATAPSYGFDSKEYTSNRPVLQVNTQATGATITQVQYYYRFSSDNAAWGAWTATGSPVTAAPYSLTFTFPNQGYYEFYSIATDSLGNVQPAPAGAQTATHYTTTPAYYPMVSLDNLYQKFDGTAKAVTVNTIPNGASYSVTYNGSATVPSAIGTYAVVVTPDGNTATTTGTLTIGIGKNVPLVSTWPTASTITYGQTLASATLSGGTASVPGTFTFTSPTTTPNAGTAGQGVIFTPADTTNYSTVSGTVNVTVGQAAATVSVWPIASAITYGQPLSASILTGGTASVPGAFAFTGSATVPNAGTAGQGFVFIPTDAINYSAVTGMISVTVNPALLTITATAQIKTISAADPALTYTATGLVNGDTTAILTGSLTRVAGETVGTYAINQGTLSAGTNYTIAYTGANLTITPAGVAAPVPALGPWGVVAAAAGLGLFARRTRNRKTSGVV